MQQYNWYVDIPAGEILEQGDIIESCSLLVPSEEHYNAILKNEETDSPIDIRMINAITLSQSCDIINDKIDSIILCPIISLKNVDLFKSSDEREVLRRGNNPAYHLLNKFGTATLQEDYYVVSFRHIYSVPKKFIETLVKTQSRKRLLPPYREHLSQSFARYFMRVGLPSDISRDELKKYK